MLHGIQTKHHHVLQEALDMSGDKEAVGKSSVIIPEHDSQWGILKIGIWETKLDRMAVGIIPLVLLEKQREKRVIVIAGSPALNTTVKMVTVIWDPANRELMCTPEKDATDRIIYAEMVL